MVNNMASFWRMQTSNGKVLRFTDADEDVFFKGEVYRAGEYFMPNAITSSNELAQDKFTISGVIGESIAEEDLSTDSYLEVFMLRNEEKFILKTGWIGEVKYSGKRFTASVNSLSSKTNNLIGKCYSSGCRAEFADQYCQINKEHYSFQGEVTTITEDNSFIDSSRTEPDNYFTQGIIEFLSGGSEGKKYQVFSFQENKIYIDSVLNLKIQIGDKYKITAGCDKSLHTCINKFSNAINFRGEPFIPSRHKLLVFN